MPVNRGKARRPKPKFFMILIGVMVILGVLVYLLVAGKRDGELVVGALRLENTAIAVLLRDETIKLTERFDKAIYHVDEGAHVENGSRIADVFRWGYQESATDKLLGVQKDIYTYQLSQLEDIKKSDLEAIQLQIQQKLTGIRGAVEDDALTDFFLMEKELQSLLQQRATMLKEAVQPDEELTLLYEQEAVQNNLIATWKRDVVNDMGAGTLSFYFDGYEQALNTQTLEMINADLIDRVIKGQGMGTSVDGTSESPLYRLVNESHFYAAFLTETASPFRLVQGESYVATFNGYEGKQYIGKALAPVVGEKHIVNILEINDSLGELIGVRVIDMMLSQDVTGLRVPLAALDKQGDNYGILYINGVDTQWVQVDILAVEGDEAIVRSARQDIPLVAGGRYKKPR